MSKISTHEAVSQYTSTENPSLLKKVVASAVTDIIPLIKKLKLSKPRVVFVDDIGEDGCARYIAGTSPWPVVVLSYKDHYDLGLRGQYDGIKSSIVHELFHAYLEYQGLNCWDHDEDHIESLTLLYCEGHLSPKQILYSLKEML